ncbi:hypothetical protein HG531_010378 [Fusarium graminearum]|nr:hypothetical protein HG531_010378 [Fusarium graminearum]
MSYGVAVDDVPSLLHEWAMQTDDIALGQKVLEIPVLAIFLKGWRRERVVCKQSATETFHDTCSGKTDLADTHDTDSLAIEGPSEKAIKSKITFTNTVVGTVGLAVESLDESNGEFSDSLGRVRRNVCDHYAVSLGGFEINVVETCASQQDSFDAKFCQG